MPQSKDNRLPRKRIEEITDAWARDPQWDLVHTTHDDGSALAPEDTAILVHYQTKMDAKWTQLRARREADKLDKTMTMLGCVGNPLLATYVLGLERRLMIIERRLDAGAYAQDDDVDVAARAA